MNMRQLSLSAAFLFEDLPITGFERNQYEERSFTIWDTDLSIEWYPAGYHTADEGYCSLFFTNKSPCVVDAKISVTLTKDCQLIREMNLNKTKEWTSVGCSNFSKTAGLLGGKIELKVEISLPDFYHVRRSKSRRFQEIVKSYEKDIMMVSGKTSIKVNYYVLRNASNVFKAMLDRDHKFVESIEKIIDVGESFEDYLEDFVHFLYEEDVMDLDVKEGKYFKKFCALITFGDKYQIDFLLEYLLFVITDKPCKVDIIHRMNILFHFKRITKFEHEAKSLMLWAKENMNYIEFFELANKIAFTSKNGL